MKKIIVKIIALALVLTGFLGFPGCDDDSEKKNFTITSQESTANN